MRSSGARTEKGQLHAATETADPAANVPRKKCRRVEIGVMRWLPIKVLALVQKWAWKPMLDGAAGTLFYGC
ncbi:hypothetical protein LBMAG49_23420 [Planctomycetota bacterium]|nr:hypothetical protein LBMAG49_23420 [Planctomycetota bacterium]